MADFCFQEGQACHQIGCTKLWCKCRWFYFRVANVEGKQLRMRIINAGEGSYPRAWQGYNACASYDRKYWFRIATKYDAKAGTLEILHKPTRVTAPAEPMSSQLLRQYSG